MSDPIDALRTKLRDLPGRDRAEMARFLVDSLGPEADDEAEAGWEIELSLSRRVADIRTRRVAGKPAASVFAEIRERVT